MLSFLTACLLASSLSFSDDIYLKTGYVLRNIQVLDTTNGRLRYKKNDQTTSFDTALVLDVESRTIVPGEEPKFELFSPELRDHQLQYAREHADKSKKQQETILSGRDGFSTQQRDSMYTWSRSVYLAGRWGSPQGCRFELGYNFEASFALALSFGIGDS
jgi:hypothetical protein